MDPRAQNVFVEVSWFKGFEFLFFAEAWILKDYDGPKTSVIFLYFKVFIHQNSAWWDVSRVKNLHDEIT